jgi:hypothetical protein
MGRINAILLFLESLRRMTEIAIAGEANREIYAREFLIHPDGGAICSLSTDGCPTPLEACPEGLALRPADPRVQRRFE